MRSLGSGGLILDGGREKSGPFSLTSGAQPHRHGDDRGQLWVSCCVWMHCFTALRNSEGEVWRVLWENCACVYARFVFWLTARLEPDHLHLPVFHTELMVRLHLKKAFSFWLKNV